MTKAPNKASETKAAEPIAKPLPMAAVVLPAASSASVRSRTASPIPAIRYFLLLLLSEKILLLFKKNTLPISAIPPKNEY